MNWFVKPSSLLSFICQSYKREFRLRLGADKAKTRAFWSSFLSRPESAAWAAQHPYLAGKVPADLVCTVPLVVHTDAGPCTKSLSCTCISWSSLLGGGPEKLTKFLAASYLKPEGEIETEVWKALLQDLDSLAEGEIKHKRKE